MLIGMAHCLLMDTPCNSSAQCSFPALESALRHPVLDGPVVNAHSWPCALCWTENPLPAASNISACHQKLFVLSKTAMSHSFCSARGGRSSPLAQPTKPTWRLRRLRRAGEQAFGATAHNSEGNIKKRRSLRRLGSHSMTQKLRSARRKSTGVVSRNHYCVPRAVRYDHRSFLAGSRRRRRDAQDHSYNDGHFCDYLLRLSHAGRCRRWNQGHSTFQVRGL
jgi:hypothetical protein